MSEPRPGAPGAAEIEAYLGTLGHALERRCGPGGTPLDTERLLEEIRVHIEDSTADLCERGGWREEEAVAEALRRLGSAAELARAWGEHRSVGPRRGERPLLFDAARWEVRMSSWLRDLRLAARSLARAPGHAAAFVLTLTLGIGANAAVFSVVDGVLLRPLPYADGERLVYLRHEARRTGVANALFSVPEIRDYRERASSFQGVAEFSALTFTVLGLDQPRELRAGIVTGNYFSVMGLAAALGRTISDSDDGAGAAPVAVLTHELWVKQFGADPGAIGRVLRMNGRSVEIVGVATPAPPWPERTDLYVNMVASPHHLSATMNDDRLHRMTEIFARLAPEVELEEARREIEGITARLHAEHPEAYDETQEYAVSVAPLREQLAARARPTLVALLGVTALVLVIACANVANLTLARVLRRREELALRASLGASAWTLRRQLLAESLIPSLAGAGLGCLVAWSATSLLARWVARYTVRASEIRVDAGVLLVCLATGLGAAVVFALLPRLPGSDPRGVADASARTTASISGRRTQRGLVVAQVATCFALLVGAGLLLRTLLNLQADDGGLALDTLAVEIPIAGRRSDEERRAYYETILERAAALPGVSAAALGGRVPLRGEPTGLAAFMAALELELESLPVAPGSPLRRADYRPVSRDYFRTVGLRILEGRGFEATDGRDTAPVVVVNRAFAQRYFGDRSPIGHRLGWRGDILRFTGISDGWREIVGVVSDSADFGVGHDVPAVVYLPASQEPAATALFLRTGTPSSTARSVISVVHRLDPDQPVGEAATLSQIHAEAIAPQRLNATLVGAFALLALAIASVGIGGVLAFGVSERTRELGVRAALGADRGRLVRMVLAEGAALAAIGLLIGGALSAASSRLVEGLLFRVPPADPATLGGVAAGLMAVALAASWAPAWRAARIDPVRALRAD